MSNKIDELNQLLVPAIEAMEGGVVLWGIEFVPGARQSLLRLYIDAEGRAVGIEDCEAVSREVSALLDVNDPIAGNYNLEVSSPGLDRPFFRLQQFERFIGAPCKIALLVAQDGRRRVSGKILRTEAEAVVIAEDAAEIVVPFNNIQKARLVPQFDEPSKTPRRKRKDSTDRAEPAPSDDGKNA